MPLESGSSEGAFKRNVSTLMGEVGKSPHVQSRAQALAIAYSKKRGHADGGLVGYADAGSVPPIPIIPSREAEIDRIFRSRLLTPTWRTGPGTEGRPFTLDLGGGGYRKTPARYEQQGGLVGYADGGMMVGAGLPSGLPVAGLPTFAAPSPSPGAPLQMLGGGTSPSGMMKAAEGGNIKPPPPPAPPSEIEKLLASQRLMNLFNYYVPKREDGGSFARGGLTNKPSKDDAAVLVPVGEKVASNTKPSPSIVPMQDPAVEALRQRLQGYPTPPPLPIMPYGQPLKYATGGLGRLGASHLGGPQMGAMGRLAGFGTGQIARSVSLGGFKRRAEGGPSEDDPADGNTLDNDCVHLVQSEVPGRTDRIPMTARAGSYILPADVVSGLGQGNTTAGAKMWADVLKLHMQQPKEVQGGSPGGNIRMPPHPMSSGAMAAGGVDEDTDIVVAGGEVVVSPECVAAIGGGDPDKGKELLNQSVLSVRKQVNEHNKALPGPVE